MLPEAELIPLDAQPPRYMLTFKKPIWYTPVVFQVAQTLLPKGETMVDISQVNLTQWIVEVHDAAATD